VGFVPYASGSQVSLPSAATFPHSMENFYIKFRTLMNGPNSFDWSYLENILNTIASHQNQGIGRVYLDYPGTTMKPADAIPDYLINGLKFYSYNEYGGGVSPDWENQTLGDAMVQLITALGKKYDKDPRIAFWQVGFLGHWAEWHDEEIAFASKNTQDRILLAFNSSFPFTQLLVRYPDVTGNNAASSLRIGYHDDSFGQDTLIPDSWGFMSRMNSAKATEQWKTVPIGGELRPELQLCIFAANPQSACAGTGLTVEPFNQCVTTSHSSWQWNYQAWGTGYSGDDYNRALAGSVSQGYSFYVQSIVVSNPEPKTGTFTVDVYLQNNGVAPFYYPLNLIATYENTKFILSSPNGSDLRTLLPSSQPVKFSATLTLINTLDPISISLYSPQSFLLKPIIFAIDGALSSGIITVSPPM